MTYLGIEFKNYEELRNWTKEEHIREYKRLAEMFAKNGTMEISSMISDQKLVLHDSFGMDWEEIEDLENEVFAIA